MRGAVIVKNSGLKSSDFADKKRSPMQSKEKTDQSQSTDPLYLINYRVGVIFFSQRGISSFKHIFCISYG